MTYTKLHLPSERGIVYATAVSGVDKSFRVQKRTPLFINILMTLFLIAVSTLIVAGLYAAITGGR